MADASGSMTPERKLGSVILGYLMFWRWTVKPRKPKDPKAKKRPVAWWEFWRFKFWMASPPSLKRSPIPSLGGLVKLDAKSWDILQLTANFLAAFAVAANLLLVTVYAAVVASQSVLPLIAGWDFAPHAWGWVWHIGAFFKWSIIVIFAIVATITAGVLQFGTDFAIPFGVGLANEKFRVVPSLAVVLWVVCAVITVSMKVDVYTGWGRERMAEAAQTSTSDESYKRTLERYKDAIPPPVAASDALVEAANANITRMEAEAKTKTGLRDDEDKNHGGRGDKWKTLDGEVTALNTGIATERTKLAAAITAKANRIEYEDADKHVRDAAKTVSVARGKLLYDDQTIVWMRSIGAAFFSFIMVLISFMVRSARADQARRKEAAQKANQTKQENANTYSGEWEEAASVDAHALPHDPSVVNEVVAPADTPTRTKPSSVHPDKAGDDYGALNNGHDSGEPDGTN